MDQNLTYQKARRIRGTKLTDLLSDQLMYEPTIGKAIKKTISLKLQSRVKGFKERFDPLNIVKYLTMGSSLGPALYGKLAGRDPRDVQYFTGRTTPIRVGAGKSTASKITPLPGGEGNVSGINEQLLKIYNFLQTSTEQEIKRKEKEQNFAEEKALESEKRHKEFLDALKKLRTGKTTVSKVTKKEEKEGFDFSGLVEGIISKVRDMVEGMIKAALKIYEWVTDLKILKDLVSFVPKLLTILGWFATPLGLAFLAATTAGSILAYLGNEQKKEIESNPYDPKFKDNAYAMVLRGEAKTVGEATQMNIAKSVKTFRRPEVEEFVKSDLNDDELKGMLGRDRAGLQKWLNENPKATEYKAPVKGMALDTSDSTPIPDQTDAETARLNRQNAQTASKVTPVAETEKKVSSQPEPAEKKAVPVVPEPVSKQLNTVMKENVSANLPSKPDTDTQSVVNNLVQSRTNQKQELASLAEIAVHNDEPTFLRMIINSTRIV